MNHAIDVMIFLFYCDMNDDPFELCVSRLMDALSLGCCFCVSTGARERCFFCVGLIPLLDHFGLFFSMVLVMGALVDFGPVFDN